MWGKTNNICICGRMDIWIHEYMDMCGYMGTVSGYLIYWVYGYMDIWIYGHMDVWIYGCMDIWIWMMDLWIYGYTGIWKQSYLSQMISAK